MNPQVVVRVKLCALEALVFCYKAYLVMIFWVWFLVPLGVVKIHYAHAIGLCFFAAIVLSPLLISAEESLEPGIDTQAGRIGGNIFYLGALHLSGFIIQSFM